MDLNVAYTNVVNPIQLDNPVAAGQMFTADSLYSAYSRRRLSVLPKLPIGSVNVTIPEEYRSAEIGRCFLLFYDSFPTILCRPLDKRILCFDTRIFFKKICNATVVHMNGTFQV